MWQSSGSATGTSAKQAEARDARNMLKVVQIKDHSDEDVHIAWIRSHYDYADSEGLPACPIQVYVLDSAEEALSAAQSPDLASKFVPWLEHHSHHWRAEGRECHYEIYTRGFSDYLACVAHQRREIAYRNRSAIWPRLITSWAGGNYQGDPLPDPADPSQGHEYTGFVLIIDRDDWNSGGIVAMLFDRLPFDRDCFRQGVPYGLENVAVARRLQNGGHVNLLLNSQWTQAGAIWMQQYLTRRNEGGQSPALYPAQDPFAHHDVDFSDHENSDSSSSTDSASLSEPVNESIDQVTALDFDANDIWKRANEFPYFKRELYEDTVGWQITTVWDRRCGKARPEFAFTAYLGAHSLPLVPESLFGCLNRGMLCNVPWRLDLIPNIPDIESALRHYTGEARRRTLLRTVSRAASTQMILDKVAQRLPKELRDNIQDILVPPFVVDFASLPESYFRNIFLYLDAGDLAKGPKIVYSDPIMTKRPIDSGSEPGKTEFQVTHLQFWPLVVNEMHTLWTLCAPRFKLPADDKPCFKMKLEMAEECSWRHGPSQMGFMPRPSIRMTLTLTGQQPVTLHKVIDDFFEEALILEELQPRSTFPSLPTEACDPKLQRALSWSDEPAFTSSITASGRPAHEDIGRLETFLPGEDVDLTNSLGLFGLHDWWEKRLVSDLLEPGRSYRIRVAENLRFRRWTFGTVGNLKGPYNLPPIPVYIKGQKEFTLRLLDPGSM